MNYYGLELKYNDKDIYHEGNLNPDGKVDKVSGKGLSTNDYTTVEKNKLAGIENGATADMTATEILTAIKTVDGNGSGLDADTVGGYTVNINVPSGAKFTDTVYSHPSSHPASMITESSTKRFVSDSEKSTWNSKSDTDTVTTINGKTGVISKADIVALGIPSTDTNTTYTEITTAEIDNGTSSTLRTITGRRVQYIIDKIATMISTAIGGLTKANVGLNNVDNVQQASKSEFNTHNSDNTKHITSTERTNWNSAKTHADTAHAPSNAQKNSDITKAEIEAKLTGTIGTHSHTVTKANVGLGNVDNTSDINKPVSTATKNAIDLNSVPFVAGTQTATTASWTGVLDTLDDIYDGLTIRYWLPRTSASSVTLNLTLKGGTTTGAIPCYYSNSSRLSTHYATGNIIVLTYVEGKLANGVSRTGWYAHAQYNTTYSIISETEIDAGTVATGRIITAQRLKYITDKIQTLLNGKVDNSRVLTDVPANAKFTDTNTTYVVATTSVNGLMSSTDKSKLNGIEAGANNYVHPTGTNPHGTTKYDVGLGNVTNESKATMFSSPSFTGTPTAPTPVIGDSTTKLATTEYVQSAMASAGTGDMLKSVYDTDGDGKVNSAVNADNSDKVGGFTVGVSVPVGAKFTDTVYSHPSTHPISMISGVIDGGTF